ncbi:uncharacterized protein MYCGRDRAFT_74118 [Zymoseptoria tritici IPO323]|uniref:Glycosyl transferase family 25 domain-containing protein n=3 Tax=Zymoseptoria tritici TaxID=1047171 RepID=F9XG24_ZYMTI|nr:uncharacterized protein MYCGRDRAFT_74118 [Zymoseptoria tritici IPO323]EGP85718.1 hypothetical protein MYCGRDRAFT_74118 [Zymoseptoria tritici IPO323]
MGMPERHDKRDALTLAASLSDLEFEWEAGVDGSAIVEKAKPPIMDKELTLSNKTLGCWRAHMNALQRVVKENIQTALIMEDDVDWDVNIKQLALNLAHGTKYIEGSENRATRSPYGDDWELLWLGHCGMMKKPEPLARYYITDNDPTVVPPSHFHFPKRPLLDQPPLSANFTRLVFKPELGICAYAYAVTLEGARRLLHQETQSFTSASAADFALRRFCRVYKNWGTAANCIGAWPSLFTSYRAPGPTGKDSDRTTYAGPAWRDVGMSSHTVFSTRLNFEALLKPRGGSQRVIKSQWPDETLLREYTGELKLPQGRGIELVGHERLP